MSNQKNTTPVENAPEKAMTKYDRKMQARREAELRDKKQSAITKAVAIVVLALIIVVAIAVPVVKRVSAGKEYVRIGNHSINQIEYDFYYGYSVNTFLYTYSAILPYMGLDTTADFSTQMFDENTTWKQYFNQLTLNNIKQYLALSDDAAANNYTFDVDADYDAFYASMKESADEEGISLKKYLKNVFGGYASKSTLKDAVTTFITAQSYYTHLYEENTPSAEEITAHYNENKKNYDTVDYRSFGIAADIAEGATEEETAAALAEASQTAENFATRVRGGEDFKTLCAEYATEDAKENYTGDKDSSLKEDATYTSTSSVYNDWLFDEARAAGEVTVLEDTENDMYYIVTFLAREYDAETQNAVISDELAGNATSEYVSGLMGNYKIEEINRKIDLPVTPSSDSTESTDNADSSSETTAE